MIRRYFGWRAGALVMGCALGALLASPPAQAQCVGDCNGDGMVAINELIIGVNIALGAQSVSACPSFDVNGNGEVAINELITAVNNALGSCLVNTPTATDTATETPHSTPTNTLPAGTATATITETPIVIDTPTPTATGAPTQSPLGSNVCTLGPDSQLFLQTAALPLPLVPTGTFSIDCGSPAADGRAECACKLINFGAVVIPALGDVCISPVEGCTPGHVDCDGGAPLDVGLNANHNIGSCNSNAGCASSCDTYCAARGEGFARQGSGCEGYCLGGSNDEMACSRDSECTGGQCVGGEPVAHFDTCNCVCAGTDFGSMGAAGALSCNLGTQINVELPSSGICGDRPAAIQLPPVCGPITTQTSGGVINNANSTEGATIPAAGPAIINGAAISCESFSAHNITGLKLVGQLAFFDSTLGDIRSGNTLVCQ